MYTLDQRWAVDLMMNFRRLCKYYYYRLKRLQGSPQSLAGGTAIGVFAGFTPTIPFHTAIIIVLTVLTRTSTLAAIIVSWIVCNPLTFFPLYYLSALVGNHITPYTISLAQVQLTLERLLASQGLGKSMAIILELGYETVVVMLAGGIAVALIASIAAYFAALPLFFQLQHNKKKKQIST